MDTADVVELFKGNLLYAMFPNLDTEAGQAVLTAVTDYVMTCLGGYDILKRCPKLFECYVIHMIAWIIATWGFSITQATETEGETDGSTFIIPPVVQGAITYLKKTTVGRESCEWSEVTKCRNCNDSVLAQLKSKWQEAQRICEEASSPLFMGGGSNWPDCNPTGCCGADHSL